MADRLFLSYWLNGYTAFNMLRHYEKALRQFPYSRLEPRLLLRVLAVNDAEPPLLEQVFADGARVDDVLAAARAFQAADTAHLAECCWDLWQYQEEWKLRPQRVTLCCYGPEFPSEMGEQLRVEFGLETQFLPAGGRGKGLLPVRSNIRALLRLVADLDQAMSAQKRLLWSESGGNFAQRLRQALEEQ